MKGSVLDNIRDLIQEDVGGRGLASDPAENLLTICPDDFHLACHSVAHTPEAFLVVVTGFYIPQGTPPAAETDGPLGALFLARALVPAGIKVVLATDDYCLGALDAGLKECGLQSEVPLVELPAEGSDPSAYLEEFRQRVAAVGFAETPTHLVALERVGPSHSAEFLSAQPGSTPEDLHQFLNEVPAEHHNRCHNMRGRDITEFTRPAHLLFEAPSRQLHRQVQPPIETIGIGDGGNEIGMGKVPWQVIRRNIPRGGLVACRVPVNHLIVCGVSNWGAYGLAAGVRHLRGKVAVTPDLFDVERERELLRILVERGPLVDGVTGLPTVTVDGLPFDRYAAPLARITTVLERG
jgi:hypothetical protein